MTTKYNQLLETINALAAERYQLYLELARQSECRKPSKRQLQRLHSIDWRLAILQDQKNKLSAKLRKKHQLSDPLNAIIDDFTDARAQNIFDD